MQKTNICERQKRIVSILLALVMFASVFFCVPYGVGAAYGADEPSEPEYDYVALGDSVIFGTTLDYPEKDGCVTLLTKGLVTVTGEPVVSDNLAVKGWDTANILDMLINSETAADTEEKLSHAKYITLNVGGNNLLNVVFAALKDKYNIPHDQTVQDYFSSNFWEALGLFKLTLDDFTADQLEAIYQGVARFDDEFHEIIDCIKMYAPDAKLAVSTIYNPFSSMFAIKDGADGIIVSMNDVIKELSEVKDYVIADVYTSFRESEVRVVNAQLNPIDFFHPNIAGHRNIANEYLSVLTGHKNVDSVKIVGDKDITYEYVESKPDNTMEFTATVTAALGAKDVEWSLSPEAQDIASVNTGSGLVTFTGKEGAITLTATSIQDAGKSDSKNINVIRKEEEPAPQEPEPQEPDGNIPVLQKVTQIRTPFTSLYITKGKKLTLPIELYNGKVNVTKGTGMTFASSNNKIVSVDKNGKIKGLKGGKAKITVRAENGKTLIIQVNVVKKAVRLKKFTLSGVPSKNVLKVGASAQLKIKLNQKKASNLKVTFKSSKPKIISVDKAGKITALKKGKAVISVKVGAKTVKTKTIIVK